MSLSLNNTDADIFIPDHRPVDEALPRTTHLGFGAHQDDLEILAFHGIANCINQKHSWFTGVVCSDGAGSPRTGQFAHYSDVDMRLKRREEQRAAATMGQYAAMLQLDYPSASIRRAENKELQQDLAQILQKTQPETVYLHNPADKHPTHVSTCLATLQALRTTVGTYKPKKVLACEVWRDLDWLPDGLKVELDVSGHEQLSDNLLSHFESQIKGGKHYDRAISGRRAAHATFRNPHEPDRSSSLIYAMDLTPLVYDPSLSIHKFVLDLIDSFRNEVDRLLKGRI